MGKNPIFLEQKQHLNNFLILAILTLSNDLPYGGK